MGICTDESRFNVAMGLVEILTNSIEHGNLGITGPEKAELKGKGEQVYQSELRRRLALPECARRTVIVEASCTQTLASVTVTDEGPGFEFSDLPDPTDPENLFKPSGRGIMLARAFLDGVEYSGRGNTVILTKFREGGSA
jgi:anti-sigma regulatory factor (Ser/Thr protein kinase)